MSSAVWVGKRVKKKKGHQKRKKESLKLCSDNNSNNSDGDLSGDGDFGNCMGMQDVWCGLGIGFSGADAVLGQLTVLSPEGTRRLEEGRLMEERNLIKGKERERERERERPCLTRRSAVNPEAPLFLDTDPGFVTSFPEQEVFGTRYYRHFRHPSPYGLARMMVLQNRFIMGGRLDHFSNWRLDIDHMTYEQLLELGDRIGYVNTGLKEDEISSCVKKIDPSIIKERPSHLPMILEKKCSICQDEFEEADEVGKLDCGHGFHMKCIKQWLAQKNTCPVCKTEPVARG